jgi:hypothetical protein
MQGIVYTASMDSGQKFTQKLLCQIQSFINIKWSVRIIVRFQYIQSGLRWALKVRGYIFASLQKTRNKIVELN